MTRGLAQGRVRRGSSGWTVAGLLVVLALGLIAAFGGFARSDERPPAIGLDERVALNLAALTVHDVRVTNVDSDGKPFPGSNAPAAVIVVRARVELLDRRSRTVSADQLLLVKVDGLDDPLKDSFTYGATATLQPGLPAEVEWSFVSPDPVPTTVNLVLTRPTFEWSNLLNEGPAWTSAGPYTYVIRDTPVRDDRQAAT